MQVQVSQKARRVRVERGLYYRDAPAGRRYEITYTDSTGRQRWQVVDGGVKDARAKILDKLVRGERVAPTKQTVAEYAKDWLATQDGRLRPTTHALYTGNLDRHVLPRLGRRQLAAVSIDDVAGASAWGEAGAADPRPRRDRQAARVGGRGVADAARGGDLHRAPAG